ncbi:hypothetical protein [Actinomadura madurae]|nr:hypothetical protein [Actinomadura madurae]MCP9950283.1 hypothetical protein [Actinomadura madurae]MCP9979526.1 hypothetical protein [Actinomadura madurae]
MSAEAGTTVLAPAAAVRASRLTAAPDSATAAAEPPTTRRVPAAVK